MNSSLTEKSKCQQLVELMQSCFKMAMGQVKTCAVRVREMAHDFNLGTRFKSEMNIQSLEEVPGAIAVALAHNPYAWLGFALVINNAWALLSIAFMTRVAFLIANVQTVGSAVHLLRTPPAFEQKVVENIVGVILNAQSTTICRKQPNLVAPVAEIAWWAMAMFLLFLDSGCSSFQLAFVAFVLIPFVAIAMQILTFCISFLLDVDNLSDGGRRNFAALVPEGEREERVLPEIANDNAPPSSLPKKTRGVKKMKPESNIAGQTASDADSSAKRPTENTSEITALTETN